VSGALFERVRTAAYDRYLKASYRRAARHRRRLENVLFVGVTGSAGKTTTKDLVAAVLATRWPGTKSPGTHNTAHWVPRTVLGVRRSDGFCVQEMGASGPGSLDQLIEVVRPHVVVITNIGGDHRKAFRTLDATATEKGKLVTAVPADGFAVLNADDPRVMGMAGSCRGRVLTYGLNPDATVHAESVSSSWPDRLSFTAIHRSERAVVRTRFSGTHWIHACLAALATGVGVGIPLVEAAAALAGVEPWSGRLNEVEARGVTFIRDECKASLWSIGPALEFLRSARAARKVAIIGTISDYSGRASAVYASVARQALEVADEVIFVGPQAHRCGAARAHPKGAALHAFLTAREAQRHLSATLVPGDLVLLKGSQRADHLLRLVLARQSSIACWRTACRRIKFCDQCVLLHLPELPWPRRGRTLAGEPADA
jgi:UDP-N-acetylmuramyl pentapeptide synthase